MESVSRDIRLQASFDVIITDNFAGGASDCAVPWYNVLLGTVVPNLNAKLVNI